MSANSRRPSSSSSNLFHDPAPRDEDRPVYVAALLAVVAAVFALLLEHSHHIC